MDLARIPGGRIGAGASCKTKSSCTTGGRVVRPPCKISCMNQLKNCLILGGCAPRTSCNTGGLRPPDPLQMRGAARPEPTAMLGAAPPRLRAILGGCAPRSGGRSGALCRGSRGRSPLEWQGVREAQTAVKQGVGGPPGPPMVASGHKYVIIGYKSVIII